KQYFDIFFCSSRRDFLTPPGGPSSFRNGPPLAKAFIDSGRSPLNDSSVGTTRRHRRESVDWHLAGRRHPPRQGGGCADRGRAGYGAVRHLAAVLDAGEFTR